MKEFSYKVNLCIVGADNMCNQIFLNYLEQISLSYQRIKGSREINFIQDEIPLKVNPFISLNFQELIDNFDQIKRINLLIYVVNIHDVDSINIIDLINYKMFLNRFKFKGLSALVGMDFHNISKINLLNHTHLNEFILIKKARELEFIYCFKLSDVKEDFALLYTTLFKDIILKFKILNPDLYEKAREYALDLLKKI